MSLRDQIAKRTGDSQYQEVLPDNLLEQFEEDDQIDPEELDLTVPTGELYPDWTGLRAFVTTFAVAGVLWPALLVIQDHLSTTQLLAGNLPIDDLLTFTVYLYLAVSLAVGTGVSAAIWYVLKAPPMIREQLDSGPVGTFISATLLGGVILLLVAVGGWLLVLGGLFIILIFLLILLVVFLGSILVGFAGLLQGDGESIATAIVVFLVSILVISGIGLLDGIWPSGIPPEYYALGVTYMLAVVFAAVLPSLVVDDDLEEYRKQLGEVRTAHKILTADIQRLQEDSPHDYPVEVSLPTEDTPENLSKAVASAEEGFDLVDAYRRHLGVQPDIKSHKGSNIENLLSTAAAVTHPGRCTSPAVAADAANALSDLVSVCNQNKTEFSDNHQLMETDIWQVCNDLASSDTTAAGDVQRLQGARDTFEDWLAETKEQDEFYERVNELRTGLASAFDNLPPVDLDPEVVDNLEWKRLEKYERVLTLARQTSNLRREHPDSDLPEVLLKKLREDAIDVNELDAEAAGRKWERIEQYERLLSIAGEALTLRSEYPDADLSEAVLERLRADAIDADDLDPYELLIEAAEQALEATDDHGLSFDQARSQVLQIAQTDPAGQSDNIEAIREVLERGLRIAEFLDTVDHDHPSVEASEWRDALDTATEDAFPNVLRPIDNRIEAMNDGMWERSDLYAYDWQEFETLVGSLYSDEGYEIEVTADTNDEGVDVWARSPRETVAIQVKQNSQGNTVGRRVLQQLASTIAKGSADRVVVVTSAEFADTAVEYATEFGPEMNLIDGEDLVQKLSTSDLPPP